MLNINPLEDRISFVLQLHCSAMLTYRAKTIFEPMRLLDGNLFEDSFGCLVVRDLAVNANNTSNDAKVRKQKTRLRTAIGSGFTARRASLWLESKELRPSIVMVV